MANPFTRPVAYKYKPLGFEAFAAPLARKQAAYDTTIEAYDDMSFDLPELPGDEKQVKAIESKLTNNLTALALLSNFSTVVRVYDFDVFELLDDVDLVARDLGSESPTDINTGLHFVKTKVTKITPRNMTRVLELAKDAMIVPGLQGDLA